MGFCLLEEADAPGIYLATNVAHVADVQPQSRADGSAACALEFGFPIKHYWPLVRGAVDDIHKLLRQASKIGLNKVETEILTGEHLRPMPLLINQPDRVAFVRELKPEEFFRKGVERAMASELFFSDGTSRIISGRPGVFAARVNAAGKVPLLDPDERKSD